MNNNAKSFIGAWISAARLRTLPLALASIGMGNFIHAGSEQFHYPVFFLGMLTTVFLQVLSNFANDLGDSMHGADHAGRMGPSRMVQSGTLSATAMKRAVILMAFFSLLSGVVLLGLAFSGNWIAALPLFISGLLAIAAAWFYTNGTKPYGYVALGDVSVFVFFGLLGVLGSAWLQVQTFEASYVFPAIAAGCWSVAVMNLNNLRDMESDRQAGKQTIPLLLGKRRARIYHLILVFSGIFFLGFYGIMVKQMAIIASLPGLILMLSTLPSVLKAQDAPAFDRLLKPQALGTFLAVAGMLIFRIFL